MSLVKMIIIPADLEKEVVLHALSPQIEAFQIILGGPEIRTLPSLIDTEHWAAYANAQSQQTGQPNERAHDLLSKLVKYNKPIYGHVLIVGVDKNGKIDDVPQVMIDRLTNVLVATPRAKRIGRAKDLLTLYSDSDEALQDLLTDLQHYADSVDEEGDYWDEVVQAAEFIHDDENRDPEFGRDHTRTERVIGLFPPDTPGRKRAGLRPLTPYDTGEQLEPKVWPQANGKVDFDNDEKATEFTINIHPSKTIEHMAIIEIDKGTWDGAMIVVNGELVATIPAEEVD